MKRYAIPGVFVGRALTGVTRYSWEIIDELDKMIAGRNIAIDFVVPIGVDVGREYENIRIVHYGKNLKFLWLNFSFLRYLRKERSTGVHLGVNVPWLRPDIVCIYDVNSIANPQFFSKYHYLKTKFEKKLAVRKGKKVFTISHFSAQEIEKYIGGRATDFAVIPCGWQHMDRIIVDGDSLSTFGAEKGSYYFSMSSIAPTKNSKWVIEAAKQNKDQKFIIAGGTDPKSFGISSLEEEVPNVKYVGRISDEDAKLLMRDCKAFIFPSYYEGFGIPPMEAFACGAPEVIVSDIPVMHEVYGTSAHYIDPFNYENIDVNLILDQKSSGSKQMLSKYSWEGSANALLELLSEL